MKRFLPVVLILFSLANHAGSQNPNPQSNFSSAVLSVNPSLYVNFNDASTNFLDQISGLTFSGTGLATTTINNYTVPTTTIPGGTVAILSTPFGGNGSLNTITLDFYTAPTAGAYILVLATGSSPTFTVVSSFTVTVTATSGIQTFNSGTGFTPQSVTAGEWIGVLATSGAGNHLGYVAGGSGSYQLSGQTGVPSGAQTYSTSSDSPTFGATYTASFTSGTVTPRQPGFDLTQINNTSAEFPYNGFNAAPNYTLGAIDWESPYTIMAQVDRLNWNRTGTLVLASKGDISNINNSYWELYLQMSGNYSQLCFVRNGGVVATGFTWHAQTGICTASSLDAMPNGFNYNIMVSDTGTGNPSTTTGSFPLTMYINGLEVGETGDYLPAALISTSSGSGVQGFGGVWLSVAGGTGYANSTAFTSTGGGPNCNVTGTMTASGGVPTQFSKSGLGYGCTSIPTIVLTTPTGTGAVITPTLLGISQNATTLPLLAPGYVSSGTIYGVAGITTTQTSTYMDEFAEFPVGLNQTQIQGIFYQTKFHQEVVKTLPTPVPVLVFDDDGGGHG